jgi:hypothetical protein
MLKSLFFGLGQSSMAARREKIGIEVFGSTAEPSPTSAGSTRPDEALLRLARLIGRHLAREESERRHGSPTKEATGGARVEGST